MRWSLITSLVVHACILLAAIVVLPSPNEYEVDELESVPVDIVSLEEFSKRQSVQKDVPEPEPEKKIAPKIKVEPEIKEIAPKPDEEIKQAAREPQPQPEPKPVPEPEPVAVPEPLEELIKQTEEVVPEPEPEAKPEKKAKVPLPREKPKSLARKVAEKKKKKKKKPAFNTDDVAALLNKIDETRAAPPVSDILDGAPKPDDITRLFNRDDGQISANELDWLRQRIGRCWNVPAGARDAQNLIVKVRIQMDPLGNVMGEPRIINSSSHPVFDAAARSARAAIIGCQPYDKLPVEKYESWKDMIINFDPSLMLAIN